MWLLQERKDGFVNVLSQSLQKKLTKFNECMWSSWIPNMVIFWQTLHENWLLDEIKVSLLLLVFAVKWISLYRRWSTNEIRFTWALNRTLHTSNNVWLIRSIVFQPMIIYLLKMASMQKTQNKSEHSFQPSNIFFWFLQ